MTAALPFPRIPRTVAVPALLTVLLVAGALAAADPRMAGGLAGAIVITGMAFLLPVAHLSALLVATAIVPLDIQNQISLGGGLDSPGLLPSDALLLTGLARAVLVLGGGDLDRRQRRTALAALVVLALAGLQFVHGLVAGTAPADAGAELRVILGLAGTLLISVPVLADPARRRRLYRALVVVGLLVGLWGIAQWTLGLRFGDTEEVLASSGGGFTTAGRTIGQYAFPVAAIMALAAWTSGQVGSLGARTLLVAVIATNILAAILTFERTFWIVTIIGMGFVVLTARGAQRARVLLMTPIVLGLLFAGLSTFAPNELEAAQARFESIGDYAIDPSVRYRLAESRLVLEEIRASPVIGSGFGATIFIGRPGTYVQPKPRRYAENGYLWLVWKLGLPGALLVVALLVVAIVPRRGIPDEDPLSSAVRHGARGALVALLVATITFPSFNSLTITPAMGLLVAIALAPGLVTGFGRRATAAAQDSGVAR